jgi:outer membrane lipoprotein SlyB
MRFLDQKNDRDSIDSLSKSTQSVYYAVYSNINTNDEITTEESATIDADELFLIGAATGTAVGEEIGPVLGVEIGESTGASTGGSIGAATGEEGYCP